MDFDDEEIPRFGAPSDPEDGARWEAYRALMRRVGAAQALRGLEPETQFGALFEPDYAVAPETPNRVASQPFFNEYEPADAEGGTRDRRRSLGRGGTFLRFGAVIALAAALVVAASMIPPLSGSRDVAAFNGAPRLRAAPRVGHDAPVANTSLSASVGVPPAAPLAAQPATLSAAPPDPAPATAGHPRNTRRSQAHVGRKTSGAGPKRPVRHPSTARLDPVLARRSSIPLRQVQQPRQPVQGDQLEIYLRRHDAYAAERDAFDQRTSDYMANRFAYERQLQAYRRARADYDARYGRGGYREDDFAPPAPQ